ncbi:MAG: ribosome assembly RNA-binding protein YhbY [Ruminococcaceae bacterium]|nr:ribosome assembly RNA-binding protein YhbY [Oscillospiraceae bacterium]
MITSKQRAQLRGMANPLPAILQIGKGGICENLLRQIDDALEARELVKISILETALLDARATCSHIAKELHAEPVQAIGSKFVLYRESKENKKIVI